MSARKILEFNPAGPGLFCRHLEFLAKEQGWDLQFENHTEYSAEILETAEMAKVDFELSAMILPQLHIQPTLVRTVRSMDCFVKEDGKWYPRLYFYEALRKVLVDCARDLDIRVPAFVVGDTERARVVASVFAQIGFSEIYVVGEDKSRLAEQMEVLRRNHLGIKFHELLADELTIQSVSGSIIVNTLDVSQNKSLLSDLSYFNFLKRDGYVMDLNLMPYHNPLLEEAERAELRVLHPHLVAASLTHLWLEKLQLGASLKVEDLRESWKSFLKQISP
ncbi:Rossmann-fold NAD(P)-binding domain-containing protein [Bdellovibrio svalbardensis]|uniref:Shikimate dehydrogenase n=1 Tax=Bdellovibrio svalbardensis TaxID=2972972 RepID=A0ABT6DKX6_9BACT|nr:hypothetical protein [Bdellovibrio svalbardensis]MDG0817526.1 hypothetical protein [Bdellovibrio svalbardensis]